jgi:hypothetical protein
MKSTENHVAAKNCRAAASIAVCGKTFPVRRPNHGIAPENLSRITKKQLGTPIAVRALRSDLTPRPGSLNTHYKC